MRFDRPAPREKPFSLPQSRLRNLWHAGTPLCMFGEAGYDPEGTYGPVLQPLHQLVLVQRGRADLVVDGEVRRLSPGIVGLLRPGERLAVRFAMDKPTRHTWVTLRLAADDPLAKALGRAPSVARETPRLSGLIETALAAGTPDGEAATGFLESLAHAVFWGYVSLTQAAKPAAGGAAWERAWACLLQGPAEVTVAEVARAAGVTRQHLQRLFHQHLGTTPSRYLWQRRLDKAYTLLVQTGLSLAEIAQLAGFESSFHLSRKLKVEYGHAPKELRRTHPDSAQSRGLRLCRQLGCTADVHRQTVRGLGHRGQLRHSGSHGGVSSLCPHCKKC